MRMGLKICQRDDMERSPMGGFQDDAWCAAMCMCFLPAWRAEAPLITGVQAGESRFRMRCGQVIPDG